MVVITGPMMSITALGKFGKVIVYSIWKGVQYARMLVTPTNPEDPDQGDRRVMLGGLGRSAKYVQSLSLYETYGKVIAPGGQSWISYYVKYIMKTYFTSVVNYDALYDEYNGHAAKQAWHAQAIALGLVAFDLDYKGMDNAFDAGFLLYCLGKYGRDQYLLDNTKFNSSPYDTAIADWVEAEILELVADFTPV